MDMDLTLRIATELHLKRLIIGGFDKVHEIGRMFRNEGISARHKPEFTSIDLHWSHKDYYDVMEITKEITCDMAKATIAVDDPNNNVNANNNMIDAGFNELYDVN